MAIMKGGIILHLVVIWIFPFTTIAASFILTRVSSIGVWICSVVFHSFAWPQDVGKARSIVRTLFVNHCDWVDVSIVRGRCFGRHRNCFRANRALDKLLWNWSEMRRPYVVYMEDNMAISPGDFVPYWFRTYKYRNLCQCHLLGPPPKRLASFRRIV